VSKTIRTHLRRNVVGYVALLTFALVCWLALGAGEASASHVDCGDTITADTTLDSDLVDCPNNGVVIGADDITLDLNGHTIDGDGTEAAGCDPKTELCDIGVANDGHDRVTVRDGSVREFGVGVLVGGARENRVVKISSTGHIFFSVVVGGSSRSVIRGGSFSRNTEGDGIGVFGSDRIRIVRNKIRRVQYGIHVFDSKKNLIKKNVFSRNGPAIFVEGADRNEVQRNRVTRGGGIIVGPGNRNVIARNRVSRALHSIAVEGGRGNLVVGNVVGRARGTGIRLGVPQPPGFGGDDTVVRRNLVRGSGDDGFLVAEKDDRSVLKRNVARRNGDDGFDVESDSAKLTKNRAVRNDDLGIEAVAGVTDGGGNRASGNGDPRQCVNVTCH
jgi:parallel beta-helix repeat protein